MQTEHGPSRPGLWRRGGRRALSVAALVSLLSLVPGRADAQSDPTNGELLNGLKTTMKGLGDWMGYVGTVPTAVGFIEKIGNFTGLIAQDPGDFDKVIELLTKMYKASDQQEKSDFLREAWSAIQEVTKPLWSNKEKIQDGTYTGWDELEFRSIHALYNVLSPGSGGQCERVSIFQVLSKSGEVSPLSYDWRFGMQTIMFAVASRLAYFTARDPNFKNDSFVQAELNDIRSCLIHHRDLIRPPLPSGPYCKLNPFEISGPAPCTRVDCKEQRTWPQWTVGTDSQPCALSCDVTNSVIGAPTFVDLESRFASKVDDTDMGSVVFNLQRQIDNLYVMSHPTKGDLAEKEPRIRFGAKPLLCLSQNQNGLVLDSCMAANATWSYDRSTGRIKNKASVSSCISTAGNPPTSAVMATCAPSNVLDERQTWSWNPETGVIKNQMGAVLTVSDPAPKPLSAVTILPENAWRFRQQAWRSDGNAACAGALCPKTGPAAWNQGGITTIVDGVSNVTTRYPLDFNIFAYEEASGSPDVAYPIAVAGNCWMSGFNLSYRGNSQGAALVVGGNLPGTRYALSNGTIHGFPYLPWWVSLSQSGVNVPWEDVRGYTAPLTEKPINFEMAFVDLDAWSQSLAGLSSSTAKVEGLGSTGYGTSIVLESAGAPANPKLEVYNLKDWQVGNIRSLHIATPAPTVLINIQKSDPQFTGASLENMGITVSGEKTILWNFPEMSSVRMRSSAVLGSVLAPRAYVNPDWGKMYGTMVAWKVIGGLEFYDEPLNTYQDIE